VIGNLSGLATQRARRASTQSDNLQFTKKLEDSQCRTPENERSKNKKPLETEDNGNKEQGHTPAVSGRVSAG
jgi:hypothetical protein